MRRASRSTRRESFPTASMGFEAAAGGDLNLTARDVTVATMGAAAYGVFGVRQGEGDLNLDAQGLAIDTAGEFSHGVYGFQGGGGDFNLTARDVTVATMGAAAYGVFGVRQGTGAASLDVVGLAFDTAEELSQGVSGFQGGGGGRLQPYRTGRHRRHDGGGCLRRLRRASGRGRPESRCAGPS